jgi:hypothetical protein
MLEIEATPFLAAVTELRHLLVLIDQIDKDCCCPLKIGHVLPV